MKYHELPAAIRETEQDVASAKRMLLEVSRYHDAGHTTYKMTVSVDDYPVSTHVAIADLLKTLQVSIQSKEVELVKLQDNHETLKKVADGLLK